MLTSELQPIVVLLAASAPRWSAPSAPTPSLVGIGLGDVFHVGTDEDQASGAALAVGGADPDLGAPDLFLKVIAARLFR